MGSSDSSTDDFHLRSSDTKTERESPVLALETKILAAWGAVKNWNRRPSMFRRRMRPQQDMIELANRAGRDVRDGIFCDSVMQLMHQSGRYDHLDAAKTPRSKTSSSSTSVSLIETQDQEPKAPMRRPRISLCQIGLVSRNSKNAFHQTSPHSKLSASLPRHLDQHLHQYSPPWLPNSP